MWTLRIDYLIEMFHSRIVEMSYLELQSNPQ